MDFRTLVPFHCIVALLQANQTMKDEDFRKKIRALSCLACGGGHFVEAHHVRHRGSGGDDRPENLIPLCTYHHTMSNEAWHFLGPQKFFEKFPWVFEHLKQLGWEMRDGKLKHPSFDAKVEE